MAAPRVLLVDDEEDIIWGLSRALVKAGYDVLTALSGEDALSTLQTQPVDILITDIKMPGMSGLDLIVEAKNKYPNIKTVVMTARGSEELMRETTERGAVEYIEKPFDLDAFLSVVARAREEGFRGVVRDLKLIDVLQILSLEKSTAAVAVSGPVGSGAIYFSEGNVVHAELGRLTGEEAFHAILEMEGGSFSLRRGAETKARTINKTLDNLLLSAVAAKDEATETAGFDIDSWSFSEAVGLVEEVRGIPDEVRSGLEAELRALMTEGVEGVGIWDSDGRPVVLLGSMSGSTAALLSRAIASARDAVGELSEALFTTQKANCVTRQLRSGEFTVGVIADSKVNPGLLRVELVKSAVRMEKLLLEV
ncbi:MAG: response regulator [candidate division WOR-3 bacterium]